MMAAPKRHPAGPVIHPMPKQSTNRGHGGWGPAPKPMGGIRRKAGGWGGIVWAHHVEARLRRQHGIGG